MPKMESPSTGVKVRMYRQGHGDCFLLAFSGREARRKKDVYVLIDCGLKPGSEVDDQKIGEIVDDIHDATDGVIDVVIATHEHQDHVNGFAKTKNREPIFDKIKFKQCWFAWTEDGTNDLANRLRNRFRDTLVTLAFAQERLAGLSNSQNLSHRLSDVLGTETGEDGHQPNSEGKGIVEAFRSNRTKDPFGKFSVLASNSVKGISNKKAMRYLRNRAEDGVDFLGPQSAPKNLPNVKGLKVYALGPPLDEALLLDLEPKSNEEFHLASNGNSLALDGDALGLAAAVSPDLANYLELKPFSQRYNISPRKILEANLPTTSPSSESKIGYLRDAYAASYNEWRRIDDDWLGSIEGMALRLNNEVNNTSLVLAFELPTTGKVLLFTGDAQRGSWIGWSDLEWAGEDGSMTSARDLLSRCVLYKVGHHGSHNATLKGTEVDDYANLGWMARGAFADEFVAMIPANTSWALGKSKPWAHPLPQIEAALMEKARGRVFRSDQDHIAQPDSSIITDSEWLAFKKQIDETPLYFEYSINDK